MAFVYQEAQIASPLKYPPDSNGWVKRVVIIADHNICNLTERQSKLKRTKGILLRYFYNRLTAPVGTFHHVRQRSRQSEEMPFCPRTEIRMASLKSRTLLVFGVQRQASDMHTSIPHQVKGLQSRLSGCCTGGEIKYLSGHPLPSAFSAGYNTAADLPVPVGMLANSRL